MAIKINEELKFSVWATKSSEDALGWHREYKELEEWCRINCNGAYVVVKPTPVERVFVFDEESDALAFKLTWG